MHKLLKHSSVGKESACNAGDPSSIPGSGRSPGEGKGYPLQYSGLENFMDCNLPGSSVVEFSRQEYWSGLPFPSPGDLPDPGIKPRFPVLQADSLPSEPPQKPSVFILAPVYCP